MFCDEVKIKLKAGDGGDGTVSFLHEKYREYGGPDGGDGGKGGDVILKADEGLNTLYYFKTHRSLKVEDGERGKRRNKRGKGSEDKIVNVPVGTIVYEEDKEISDLDIHGKETVVVKGGEGGFGNAHFTSSVRQAPEVAELGIKGEEKEILLSLKLVADVGLIGLPNAGKSTFLSVVTKAKPKIANYPFTTLVPNLGVIEGFGFKAGTGFVIADIPGLIEGASKGKGLGDEFLKHVERNRILIHLIDINSEDIVKDLGIIKKELKDYSKELAKKPQLVAITKIDTLEKGELKEKIKEITKELKKTRIIKKVYFISAVSHEGLKELLFDARNIVEEKKKVEIKEEEEYKVFTIKDVQKDGFSVIEEKGIFIVKGKKIEKFTQKTDMSNRYSVDRLYNIMERIGVMKELKKKGAKLGDKIKISNIILEVR